MWTRNGLTLPTTTSKILRWLQESPVNRLPRRMSHGEHSWQPQYVHSYASTPEERIALSKPCLFESCYTSPALSGVLSSMPSTGQPCRLALGTSWRASLQGQASNAALRQPAKQRRGSKCHIAKLRVAKCCIPGALRGRLCHDFGLYVGSMMVLGAFGKGLIGVPSKGDPSDPNHRNGPQWAPTRPDPNGPQRSCRFSGASQTGELIASPST